MGSWDGPWNLTSQVNAGLPNDAWDWDEFAHAVVLPPPNAGWVLLWTARYCATCNCEGCSFAEAAYQPYKTFLWNPQDPSTIHAIEVDPPAGLTAGHGDLFCNGHNLTPDGHVVSFGGTDLSLGGCQGEPSVLGLGHPWVYLFDNSTPIRPGLTQFPAWTQAEVGNELRDDRWYPTASLMSDGTFLVTGHVDAPTGAAAGAEYSMELGSVSLVPGSPDMVLMNWDTLAGAFPNREWNEGALCTATLDYGIRYYPRTLALATGEVICLVADDGSFDVPTPTGIPNFLTGPHAYFGYTVFLDRGLCDMTALPDRWKPFNGGLPRDLPSPTPDACPANGMGPVSSAPMPRPLGAPAVHIVDARNPDDVIETIYSFGGSMLDGVSFKWDPCSGVVQCTVSDSDPCAPAAGFPDMQDGFDSVTAEVVRMTNSLPGSGGLSRDDQWENTTLDGAGTPTWLRMNESRQNANAVLLLDGSILVVGGFGKDDDPCPNPLDPCYSPQDFDGMAKKRAERFRPPEVFSTGDTWSFDYMARQQNERRYHSVAGLLPDGRVFSGGGEQQIEDLDENGTPVNPCAAPPPPPPPHFDQDFNKVSAHKFELYSPPYMYQGRRSSIRSMLADPDRGVSPEGTILVHPTSDVPMEPQFIVIDVDPSASTSGPDFDVALLRPGSITHAFDNNQVYVRLEVATAVQDSVEYVNPANPMGPPSIHYFYRVTVKIPSQHLVPPGYYMVTVKSGEDDPPSVATWIKVVP